jgi:Family of unknown function (DUF5677)
MRKESPIARKVPRALSASIRKKSESIRSASRLLDELGREVDATVGKNLDVMQIDAAWGLLHRMYERATGHAAACLALLKRQRFAAAEALCRTLVESSVNLYYCSVGDSIGTILAYFKDHIEIERKQNRSWRSDVSSSALEEQEKLVHFAHIDHKAAVLDSYERALQMVFQQMGYQYSAASLWPSIFDRFKAIGKEINYRTVYAALCSQAHSDPEDLLNDFMQNLSAVPGAAEAQRAENENFSVFIFLTSLALLVESSARYLVKYTPDASRVLMGLEAQAKRAASQATGMLQDKKAK